MNFSTCFKKHCNGLSAKDTILHEQVIDTSLEDGFKTTDQSGILSNYIKTKK